MRVVVAPDKFKGALTAADAARAIGAGLRSARPDIDVAEQPVADGGDGTVAAALCAGYAPVQITAAGPVGDPVTATFALRGRTAVIELAEVVGLRRLPGAAPGSRPGRAPGGLPGGPRGSAPGGPPDLAPLTASTFGLGQVIRAALDRGAETIVLGLGGSASTDGGAGMLEALGARLADQDGRELPPGGAALIGLAEVDLSRMDARLPSVTVQVASDVDSPLLGPDGAAAVYGPQKGALPDQVELLELAMSRWADLTRSATGSDLSAVPGAGAAGGTGFGALAYLGARLLPGIDLVLELIGFDAVLTGADLVITGEGRLDEQTLSGKAPLGVARAAARAGLPVLAIAGQVVLSEPTWRGAGFSAVFALSDIEPDLAVSLAHTAELLERVGQQIADSWLSA